jgi:hypothetical protein
VNKFAKVTWTWFHINMGERVVPSCAVRLKKRGIQLSVPKQFSVFYSPLELCRNRSKEIWINDSISKSNTKYRKTSYCK